MKTQPDRFVSSLGLTLLLLAGITPVHGQYVTKSNQQFLYNGNPILLYGCSFDPAAEGFTSAWHSSAFPATIHKDLTNALAAGQNIMRPTDYWDTSTPNQTFNDPVLWSNMDFLIADCKSNGIFVLMDISAWKLVLTQEGKNLTDTNNWLPFLNFIVPKYANEPTIAFWSIMGEPSVPTDQTSANALVQFYDTLTTYVHNLDGNHLICAGGFNHMNQNMNLNWWQDIYALPHNNVCAFKTYSQNDLNLTPTIGSVAQSNNKILIDEEFGMPQSQGDGTWSGQTENGLSTSVSTFYTNVYNAGLAAGAVGFQFWNLDNNQGGTHFDIWPTFMPVTWSTIQHYSPPPQPPLNLSATPVSSSQINLSWTANAESTVTGYNIYRSTTSGFTPNPGNRIASGVANNSYSDTGLASGTTYYYLVTAVNRLQHESSPSVQAGATTSGAAPPPPANLTASAGNAQVSLTWNASAGATSYNVYRSTVSGGPYNRIASGVTSTSYTDTGLSNGTTYYYVVVAVNGNGTSGNSNEANATPSAGSSSPKSVSVNFVGNGTAMGASESAGAVAKSNWNNASGPTGSNQALNDETGANSGATLTWSANHDSSEGITDTAGNNRMMNGYVNTSSSSSTTVQVANLPASANGWTVYVYCEENTSGATRVASYQISGTGITTTTINATDPNTFNGTFTQANNSTGNYVVFTIGNVAGFTITATPVSSTDSSKRAPLNGIQIIPLSGGSPPPAPTNLSATAGNAQVSLAWTASSGATSYHAKRSTTNGGPYTTIATGVTATSYTDTGLANGTTYYYVVSAVNGNGESANSTQASATPSAPAGNPISVNFGASSATPMAASETAGVVAASNWNNALGLSGNNLALNDSTGTASGATVTWNDPKSANSTSITDTAGNNRMMKYYLDSSSSTTTTATVSSLPSNSNGYKVYVYFDGNNSETREGAYTISGTGITTTTINGFDNANTDFSGTFIQANNSAGNYVVFTIGNVSGFTVSATAVNNGAQFPRGPLNGMQIVPQ